MRGLCAPAEQGNIEDGIWLEYKEVTRLKSIACSYQSDIKRAWMRGTLIGIALGFLLTSLLYGGTVRGEELYVEAWVDEVADVEEYCYTPYPSPVTQEFKAARVLVEIEYLDTGRGELVESSWYYDEETNTTICKIWIRVPDDVIGDPDMDGLGHEFLHCMIGNFHPDEEPTNV